MEHYRDELMARVAIRDHLLSMDPKELTIVIIQMNICLESRGVLFIPGEIGLTAFSIKEGIKDNYWSLIDPYHVPMGFGYDVKKNTTELGLPYPPYSNRFQEYDKIIGGLEAFLKKHENPVTHTSIAFCLAKNVYSYNCALDWLYDQIGKKHDINFGLIGDIVRPLSDIGISCRAERENIEASFLFAKYLNHDKFFLIEDVPKDLEKKMSSYSDVVQTYESTSSGYSSEPSTDQEMFATPGELLAIPTVCEHAQGLYRYLPMEGVDGPYLHDYRNRVLYPERGFHDGREVEEYLESQELSFDSEIACLHHMQPIHDVTMRHCPLQVANRFGYCILASLTGHFDIDPVIPGVHKYVRGNRGEHRRILETLKKWGYNLQECIEFSFDGTPPAKFSTRMSDELHPKSYRPE